MQITEIINEFVEKMYLLDGLGLQPKFRRLCSKQNPLLDWRNGDVKDSVEC